MHKTSWPTDFQYYQLEDICRPRQWPTISQEQLTDTGFPVYGANGIIGRFGNYTHEFPTVAITCRGATCGEVTLTQEKSYITGNAMALDQLDHTKVDPGFLSYFLQNSSLDECITGSAQPQIIGSALRRLGIYVPPISEQNQIVHILNTLHTQINQTKETIAKLEQIKQGLLTDLLSRGVDENGEIRPPPDEVPHLYKSSQIGWIPRDWETGSLSSMTTKITDGTHQAVPTVKPSSHTVPFLFVSCIRNGQIFWDSAAAIPDRIFQEISRGRPPIQGMVLYTAVGSYGHAAVVKTDRSFAFQRHIACIYPASDAARGAFIATYLNSPAARSHGDRIALGNAQKTVTLRELAQLPLPKPSMREQDQILQVIDRHDARIQREIMTMRKLRAAKRGMMDDLLRGRVRVTPLLDESQRAAS